MTSHGHDGNDVGVSAGRRSRQKITSVQPSDEQGEDRRPPSDEGIIRGQMWIGCDEAQCFRQVSFGWRSPGHTIRRCGGNIQQG